MIQYAIVIILISLVSSSSLFLVYSKNDVGHPEVSVGTNSFNAKNYFMNTGFLLDSLVLSIDAGQTNMVDGRLPETNGSNTFFAKGLLSSVLFPYYNALEFDVNDTSISNNSSNDADTEASLFEFPKLISGNWVLNVTQGNVGVFHSFFKLVTSDGLEKHFVELINFQDQNKSVILNPYSNTVINGYVDMKIDGQLFDYDLPIEIRLNKINTIALSMGNQSISDFFFNNQIQGIVDSFRNYEGAELLISDS